MSHMAKGVELLIHIGLDIKIVEEGGVVRRFLGGDISLMYKSQRDQLALHRRMMNRFRWRLKKRTYCNLLRSPDRFIKMADIDYKETFPPESLAHIEKNAELYRSYNMWMHSPTGAV